MFMSFNDDANHQGNNPPVSMQWDIYMAGRNLFCDDNPGQQL